MNLAGRHVRAIFGGVIITADVLVFLNAHLRLTTAYNWQELGVHAGFFLAGYLLIDPTSAREVIRSVAARLPFRQSAPPEEEFPTPTLPPEEEPR